MKINPKFERTKFEKCLFLDRDGVINIDYGYVHQKADFKFRAGIFEVFNIWSLCTFSIG